MRSLFQMNILAVRKRRLLTELKRSSGCGPVRCHFCRDCPHPEGHCDRRYGTLSRPGSYPSSEQTTYLTYLPGVLCFGRSRLAPEPTYSTPIIGCSLGHVVLQGFGLGFLIVQITQVA